MEFSVKSGSPEKQRSACIVVGVFEPRRLSPIAEQLDKISDGYISALLRRGELEGKPGQTLLLHHVPNVLSERILLIGCGKERELDERQYKQVIQKTINTLNDTGSMEAVCFLTELHVKGRNNYWKVRQAVETAQETLYSFDQLKTNKSEPRRPLRKMVFNVPTRRELTSGERAIQHGLAIAAGIKAAKDLGNMPPNICNAAYLASQARQLADSYSKNVVTRVIGEQQMKELGMHTLTAAIILVNNASTIAALTSTALLSPQACMTVISLSVYSLPSVISSPRNRLKGKISCAISGTPSPSSESTRFAGISPSTAAPRILTNF